ncbi:12851_t:CDS:2 [Entrophospora sp. SA101]|nr:12851_t:CDS:2 [Entrophospora sp. SA101]
MSLKRNMFMSVMMPILSHYMMTTIHSFKNYYSEIIYTTNDAVAQTFNLGRDLDLGLEYDIYNDIELCMEMTSLFNNSDDENDNSPISLAPKITLPPLVKTSFDEYDNNSLRKKYK